jgi:hypothetical protein
MIALATPRAPTALVGAALYESYYLTASDPASARALWLRYTALKRSGQPAYPTVWLTYFDRAGSAPRAWRVTGTEPLPDPEGAWVRSCVGEIGPAGARGVIDAADVAGAVSRASWKLSWQPRAPELAYLPAPWLYDRAVPRSNGAALVPAGTATGWLALGTEQVALDGWEAMVGHNWGSDHADRWCWLHAARLGDDGAGWLDLVLVRIRLGPVLTPWIAAGAVYLGDRQYAPARLGRVVCECAREETVVRLRLSPNARLALTVTAPRRSTVTWDYAGASNVGRAVDNCSVADATVRLETPAGVHSSRLTGAVAIEHGRPLSPADAPGQ